MTKRRHAEIAGGGTVGLTAACVLARHGWSVRVHERSSELREIGAGIYLWGNALRALEDAGAFDEATRRAEKMDHWELRDDRRRLLQREWMLPGTDRIWTVLRSDLLRGLADAADRYGVEIITNSKVASARPEGALVLEDGTELPADLVIGADGVNSRIRDSLSLTAKIRDLRDGASRHVIERTERDPKNAMLEHWSGGRRVGVVPCSPTDVYIYLACPTRDVEARAQNPAFRGTWIHSFPHFEHVLERIPDGGWWSSFKEVRCYSWSLGRVALCGDAAHGMAPTLAQAACVAMMAVSALATAVERFPDVFEALRTWERSERPVVDLTQRYSRYYTNINARWPQPLVDARSALVWALGRSRRLQANVNQAALHTSHLDGEDRARPGLPWAR